MKRLFLFLFGAVMAVSLTSCKLSSGGNNSALLALLLGGGPKSGLKTITALSVDGVAGVIAGATITVTLPCDHVGGLTSLPVTFTTTGARVVANDTITLTSGSNLDVSSSVILTVFAEDNTERDYTLSVSVAPAGDKIITSFSINGIAGVIDQIGHTITIDIPCPPVDALVATFTFSGASVYVGSTEQVSGTTENDFTTLVTYRVNDCSASFQDYTVTVNVGDPAAKDITAFSIDGHKAFLCTSGNKIHVTLPIGTSLASQIATFTTTGQSVTVGTTAQTSGVTVNNFTSPVTFTVHACNGTTKNYIVQVDAFTVTGSTFDDDPALDTLMSRQRTVYHAANNYQKNLRFTQSNDLMLISDLLLTMSMSMSFSGQDWNFSMNSTSAGADTVWFTTDDTYSGSMGGPGIQFRQYIDATHLRMVNYSSYTETSGYFTGTVYNYIAITLDSSGRQTNKRVYTGAGVDTLWFTNDDVLNTSPGMPTIVTTVWPSSTTANEYMFEDDGVTYVNYAESVRGATTDVVTMWTDNTKTTTQMILTQDYAHSGTILNQGGMEYCLKYTLDGSSRTTVMKMYVDDGAIDGWWDGDELFFMMHQENHYNTDGNMDYSYSYDSDDTSHQVAHTLNSFN